MAIGVEGQFYLSFSVGDQEDFIDVNDLIEFTEVSEAGNTMPTFELVFWTSNERVFGLLNETTDIRVSFGRTLSDSRAYNLNVTGVTAGSVSGKYQFRCVGTLSRTAYISNTRRRIIGPLSGIEGVRQVAEENGFTVDSNLEASEDSQRWIQANWTDRKFVTHMLLRSYVAGSFVACGISSDGTFVVRDVRLMAREEEPRWTFSTDADGSEDDVVSYDPNPSYESNTGLANYWVGYGQETAVFSLEDEALRFVSEDVRPVVALTDQLARRAGMERRFQSTALQNENVHPHYWQAMAQNVTNAAMFHSFKVTLTFGRTFRDVRVLDLASFFDPSISGTSSGSAPAQSGLYVVGKVARCVSNKQLTTTVVLCRESVNEVSGEVRESQVQEITPLGVTGTEPEPVG